MRIAKIFIATFLVCFNVACATNNGGTLLAASSGRYLQFKHPISGTISIQMTLPTPEGCAGMLSVMRHNTKSEDKDLLAFFACSQVSVSPALPLRATVRNKTYDFLLDIEAVSIVECRSMLDSILTSENKENVDIVSPCRSR